METTKGLTIKGKPNPNVDTEQQEINESGNPINNPLNPNKKLKKVKIISSDSLGSAALPIGYIQKEISNPTNNNSISKAPLSYHERKLAQDSKPYVAPTDKPNLNKKILRVGGGQVWEDPTLIHWDQDDYRLFVGDLGNEVTDDLLSKSFSQYPSLIRVKVVRDKRTNKSKGFGFLSFKDPDDYVRAMREMNGKYVGNRPISLKRSNVRETMATKSEIKRQKELGKLKG